MYGKPLKHDRVARVVFPIQILLTFGSHCNRYFCDIQLKIYRLLNFNLGSFNFYEQNFPKVNYFDYMTNYCERQPIWLIRSNKILHDYLLTAVFNFIGHGQTLPLRLHCIQFIFDLLAGLGGPWHLTFALGLLENLSSFIQIICWAPFNFPESTALTWIPLIRCLKTLFENTSREYQAVI